MNPTKPPISPRVAILFGILAVSTASIFIRFAQETTPSIVIAAYRLTLASLILMIPAVTHNRSEIRSLGRKQVILALVSGVFLALHFATWISSLEYTTVASSVVLVSTTPLWVAIFSPLILREKVQPPVLIGLLIALVGGTVVGVSDTCSLSPTAVSCLGVADYLRGYASLGDLLALVGAIMAAGYLIIGRDLRPRMSLLAYTFVVYGTAAVLLIGIVLAFRLPVTGYPAINYLWFVALAVVPQIIGHSTFNWALRYLPAAFVSVSLLGEPIGSTILAYFILNEVPNAIKLAGGALILAGIYITTRTGKEIAIPE